MLIPRGTLEQVLTPNVRAVLGKMAHHIPGAEADVTAVSDCIEELFSELGHEDIGESIAEGVENRILTEEQGRWFLGVAVWSGETNGAALQPTIERWLEHAEDSLRIGLSLDHIVLPFRSDEEMTQVLTRIISRFPQHAERCTRLIECRRLQDV